MSDNIRYNPDDLENHEAVAAVVRDREGRVLMFNHKKYGFWTIPVGKATANETPLEGITTELKEELGIAVTQATEIAVKPYVYERRGSRVHVNLHLYVIDSFEGEPKNNEPEKHTAMKYMDIETIAKLEYLSDATVMFLKSEGINREAHL